MKCDDDEGDNNNNNKHVPPTIPGIVDILKTRCKMVT